MPQTIREVGALRVVPHSHEMQQAWLMAPAPLCLRRLRRLAEHDRFCRVHGVAAEHGARAAKSEQAVSALQISNNSMGYQQKGWQHKRCGKTEISRDLA